MRKVSALIIASVWVFTVACGSSDNNSGRISSDAGVGGHATVGGNASIGGHQSVGGNASIGGHQSVGGHASVGGNSSSNGTGTCNVPACLANFGSTCAPSGACVTQTDIQTFASNTCYANGIKIITTVDLANESVTATTKNGSAICYSFSIDANGAVTLKDPSGAAVATLSTDTDGNEVVTCAGQQPVVLNSSCSSDSTVIDQTPPGDCTDGTCTP